MMESENYRERFLAEYFQTKIRLEKLKIMVNAYEKNLLSFKPICPLSILRDQMEAMEEYLNVLERRAEVEKIDLPIEIN